jgi:hypothetical protein
VTKKFRYYCEARKVVVYTDHKALLGEIKLRDESRRSVGFIMKIQEFDIDTRHVEGKKNIAEDAMSRNVVGAPREQIKSIIKKKHEKMGYRGLKLVYEELKNEELNERNLQQKVWENVIGCQICVRHNVANKRIGTRLDPIETSRSNQLLCLDVWGPLQMTIKGKRFCLVAIDHFSKISHIKPISEIKWEIASLFVIKVSRAYGKYQR